jgi:hypothetical protein
MPVDLFREGEQYVLSADLPGIDPESVDLDVDGQLLTIRAERRAPASEQVRWLAHERPYGSYMRQFTLGDGVDVEYVISVKMVEKLGGADLPEEMSVYVGKQSPSLGIVKSLDSRLGGKTFVAFMKEFRGPDGEPRWHFHFSPDTKDVVAAVKEAYELETFSK